MVHVIEMHDPNRTWLTFGLIHSVFAHVLSGCGVQTIYLGNEALGLGFRLEIRFRWGFRRGEGEKLRSLQALRTSLHSARVMVRVEVHHLALLRLRRKVGFVVINSQCKGEGGFRVWCRLRIVRIYQGRRGKQRVLGRPIRGCQASVQTPQPQP